MTHIKIPLADSRDKQLTELKLRKLKAQTAKIQAKIKPDEIKAKTPRYLSVILAILSVNFFLGDFLDW